MSSKLLCRATFATLLAGASLTLAKPSHAEQFVLFDVTFDFTWDDAINATPSKSHYYVKSDKLNPLRPTNWIAPIDYRTGKVHIYLDVLEKPAGGQKQGWALCYVGGGSYGCPYTKYYTEVGVYENEVDMTSFYNNNTIDWTKGITEVDLVYTINDSGMGHVHFFPELKDLTTPTKVRIAMVQVSKGATYDPSILPNTMGMGGMGGAGGMAGSGGSGGSAGSAGDAAGGMAAGGTSAGAPGAGMAGASGSGGTGGAGGTGGSPVLPGGGAGGAAASAGGPGANNQATSGESAGCSVNRPQGRASGGWTALALGLFGAAGLLRRRRPKSG